MQRVGLFLVLVGRVDNGNVELSLRSALGVLRGECQCEMVVVVVAVMS